MPASMGKYLAMQRARYSIDEVTMQSILHRRVRPSAGIAKPQKKAHFDRFKDLPPEVVLEIMRWINPQDLGHLVQINKNISALASANRRTIEKGIHDQQYPEYHQLFGMVGEETPDQEYNVAVEKENREWWLNEEKKAFEAWFPNGQKPQQVLGSGSIGRIKLFAALAEDIRIAATALDDEGIAFEEGSEELTRKALMLFWKMQWNDRPGLEHLCDRDDTELSYLDTRHKLFADETAEVKGRFREILRRIGSRLWKDLELWDFTIDWSTRNRRLVASEQHISAEDLERWVQGLTAELVVEVILKIGVVRAIKLDHADACEWDMVWINEKLVDRLLELLGDLVPSLGYEAPSPVFGFGRAIGLQPDKIVERERRMFTRWRNVGM
ncbi:MAG: hypothetical protein Q9213_004185 [Squamulea squamosa]